MKQTGPSDHNATQMYASFPSGRPNESVGVTTMYDTERDYNVTKNDIAQSLHNKLKLYDTA